jgi:FAD/FMN-containing dehydrogenase
MLTRKTTRRGFVALGSAVVAGRATLAPPVVAARRLPARAQSLPLTGRVIWPGDPEYETTRQPFNSRFARFPAGIVVCSSATDVQNAVRWARQHGIPLCARSGGHSYEAFSTLDDALVIDVGGLTEVTVDPARGEAVVGTGVRMLDLYRRLWSFGVTIPGGTCPGVGIAGLTLGGGIGFLSRQYGLTCDNLLIIDLVDANGDTLRASEIENPDLFWALRGGGGGNFGIATAFTFRVHPIGEVVTCSLVWPWDDIAEVLDAWQRWAPSADNRLTVALGLPAPGAGVVSATGLFTGPAAELPSLLAPLLAAGTPDPPTIQTLPYLTAAEQFAGPPIAALPFKNASAFAAEPLSAAAITTLVDGLRAASTASNLVGLFPLGGQVAAIAPRATAFPHRHALFDLQYQAYWWDPAEAPADLAWVLNLRAAMAPYTDGAYVNYIDADLPDWEWGESGPLRVRMALHAGEAVPDERGDYLAAPLNRLSRLLATAHGGQILLSQAVQPVASDSLPADVSLNDLGDHRSRDLLEPERVFQLVHPDLAADFPPLRSLRAHPNNLPLQPTPFLGREDEMGEVSALLLRPDVRLLTLTGPGGSGKTRIALQVAADAIDAFADGVFFVALTPLTDPALVPSAIAAWWEPA